MYSLIKYSVLVSSFLMVNLLGGQTQPNVIFILTDDQGSIDVNCYGAKDLYTPNIDQLAKEGVRFDQFYVAAPLCSPSRAAILTGKTPQAAGLPNNASSQKGGHGMPAEQVTIAEVFQQAGYRTGHIGKWHLGYTPSTMPLGQGFDYSYGHMGGCIDNYSHFFYWNGPNRHDLYENGEEIWADGEYFPDLMTEKAVHFIEANQQNSFFLYYAINLPHYPLQPTAKWRKHYLDLLQPRKDYAAFISTIDERIGILISTLDRLQLRDNTLIVFLSDHGHSVEERAFKGGGNAGPYRGAKGSLFEGGIRVPAIISLPGMIPEDEVRSQLVSSMDLFPTLLDYCNIDSPPTEGVNIRSVIESKDAPNPERVLYWKRGVSWAVRKDQWKLMGYPNDPVQPSSLKGDQDLLFLVNLKTDISEHTNLAARYPEKVEELISTYQQWAYATPEDIPTPVRSLSSLAAKKEITITPSPHRKYAAGGPASLVDERTGSRQFKDGKWLGFENTDVTAVIDLGTSTEVAEVIIGTLQDAGVWIFWPQSIRVAWSSDGNTYSKPVSIKIKELRDNNKQIVERIACLLPKVSCRYLKIQIEAVGKCPAWHTAVGQPAWLFLDEITVR